MRWRDRFLESARAALSAAGIAEAQRSAAEPLPGAAS